MQWSVSLADYPERFSDAVISWHTISDWLAGNVVSAFEKRYVELQFDFFIIIL